MDRLNKLKQYMEFYRQNNVGPTFGIGYDSAWADGQIKKDEEEAVANQKYPEFFDQSQGQGYQPQQYVQPNYQQQENPFTNYLRKMMNPRDEFPRGGQFTKGLRG